MSADPKTLDQWQIAVDAAEGVLALELARLLGLIESGDKANVERCANIIDRGEHDYGIQPGETAIRDFIVEAVDGPDRDRIIRVVHTAIEMTGEPRLASVVPFLSASKLAPSPSPPTREDT